MVAGMMGAGWIAVAQSLTAPFGVLAALLWAFVAIVKIQPTLRQVQSESDIALRASTADGVQELIMAMREHIREQDKKLARAEAKIGALEKRTEECEVERAELRARIVQLEAYQQGRGDARQHAALIVAAEKRGAK